MSATTRLRSVIGAVKALPDTRRRTIVLEHEHQAILAAVNAFADQVDRNEQAINRMHQTLVDADPQRALDIVTQVRDDVRAFLVEVTEQLNREAGAPSSTSSAQTSSAETPASTPAAQG
jgi:hypothetical protein